MEYRVRGAMNRWRDVMYPLRGVIYPFGDVTCHVSTSAEIHIGKNIPVTVKIITGLIQIIPVKIRIIPVIIFTFPFALNISKGIDNNI